MNSRFRFITGTLLAVLVGSGLVLFGESPSEAQFEMPETRTVSLDVGWNLAGWTGPETAFASAAADIMEVTGAAAAFKAGPQTFETWNATAPDFLNTLDTLFPGQGVWLLVTAPIDWVQPVVAEPGPFALQTGFNLITWTGQSGLDPGETFSAIETGFNAAFAFDKPTESFLSFGLKRPAFLNDLPPLTYGAGFWVLMDGPASWTHPASTPPAQVIGTNIAATLDIPRGALPPSVDAADLRVTDGVASRPNVEGTQSLLVVQLQPDGLRFAQPATVTTQVALPSGASPFVLLISGDDVEAVGGVDLAFDADTELTTLTVPVAHFSYLDIGFDGAVEAPEFIDLGDVAVGQSFSVTVPVTRLDFEHERTTVLATDSPDGEVRKIIRRRPATGDDERWVLEVLSFVVQLGTPTPTTIRPADLTAGPGATQLVPEVSFTCGEAGDFAISFAGVSNMATVVTEVIVGSDRVIVDDIAPTIASTVSLVRSAMIGTCVASTSVQTVTAGLVVMGQSFQLNFHVLMPTGQLRPLLQADTVRSALTGQQLRLNQLPQGEELFALDPNPVRLNGNFVDGGGTCGFAGFQDAVTIFVYEDVVVQFLADTEFDEGTVPADQLLAGLVGFYEGSIAADGTGTLTHRHVEDRCEHRWDVTLSNPQPTSLTPPAAPFAL